MDENENENESEVTAQQMKKVFQLLEAMYYGMPIQEFYDADLDRIISKMDDEAMDFLAAVTAATALSISLLSEENRTRFFQVGNAATE